VLGVEQTYHKINRKRINTCGTNKKPVFFSKKVFPERQEISNLEDVRMFVGRFHSCLTFEGKEISGKRPHYIQYCFYSFYYRGCH
jgi:hypothetical protein